MTEEQPNPADAWCACYHRRRYHEGRSLDCTMAGCSCRGFKEIPAPQWGGESTT